ELTLEGNAGKATVGLMKDLSILANGVGFWLLEQRSNYDPMIYAGQMGFKGKLMDIKYTVGGSYYFYKDTKGQKTFVDN
ncbi:hypothetical protein, partial [Klebsiella pneumoniae]|uniref:hypothetical protein n=1 Tax=Klebsiella pneumoniae TaxID=573 RepID=UPI00272F9C26